MIEFKVHDDLCSTLFSVKINDNMINALTGKIVQWPVLNEAGDVVGSEYVMKHRDFLDLVKQMAWED